MIKTFIAGLLTLSCVTAFAQVTIIQYPVTGLQVTVSDVFKGVIQNPSTKTYEIILEAAISNSATNQKVVTAKTKPFSLSPGMLEINEQLLRPEYTFYANVVQQTNTLPFGSYEMCLNILFINEAEQAVSSCQTVESTPLSPPLLVYPENASTIYERYPLLVWLPPMPVSGNKVLYELVLAELMANQTPYDAIQRNYPILRVDHIRPTNLQYPVNATALTTGKIYAWKVIARMENGNFIGETEIWTFDLKEPDEKDTVSYKPSYGLLQKNPDNGYVTVRDNKLYFQFDERYNQNSLTYKIFDDKNKETGTGCQPHINKELGVSKYYIDLASCREIRKGMYTLKVANEKNEVFQLRFYIPE